MEIKTIINQPITSNCFVVFHDDKKSCIVIDPGSKDITEIVKVINDRTVDFIFLTHEHFDHIWSVDEIRAKYNAKLCCSLATANAITNKKKNMSVFFDQTGFELFPSDMIIENGQVIDWKSMQIKTIYTPGHTDGSICIKINNALFTGDTIIKGLKTVTKLPTGNKRKLDQSLCLIANQCKKDTMLYPGHGDNIMLKDIIKEDLT